MTWRPYDPETPNPEIEHIFQGEQQALNDVALARSQLTMAAVTYDFGQVLQLSTDTTHSLMVAFYEKASFPYQIVGDVNNHIAEAAHYLEFTPIYVSEVGNNDGTIVDSVQDAFTVPISYAELPTVPPEPVLGALPKDMSTNNSSPIDKGVNNLIEGGLGLVRHIAKDYYGHTMTRADLEQEGSVGLVLAAQRFNPDLGHDFASYAASYIRGTILKAIRDRDKIIRANRRDSPRARAYTQALTQLEGEQVPITDEALAQKTGLSLKRVKDERLARSISQSPISIDRPLDMSEAGDERGIEVAGVGADEYDRFVDTSFVQDLIDRLEDERDKQILKYRFGISPYEDTHTQLEAARFVGVSQVQVSRLERRAFDVLREIIITENLLDSSGTDPTI